MLLKINNYDISGFLASGGLSVLDDAPVELNRITMADGSIKIILAPYTQTVIDATLTGCGASDFAALANAITNENTVQYKSVKSNTVKSAKFFIELPEWQLLRYNNRTNRLAPFTLHMTKTGAV